MYVTIYVHQMLDVQLWLIYLVFFFFKQKTAYEMRISDWSSDVCSSDLSALDSTGDSSCSRRSWASSSSRMLPRLPRRVFKVMTRRSRSESIDRKSVV